jgi:hypothetical protein
MQPSTLSSDLVRLRETLLGLLAAYQPAFGQTRVYRRAVALVLAEVLAFARHTTTQLLLVLGLPAADWSGWYRLWSRPRFRVTRAAAILFQQTLAHVPAEAAAYVAGVDQTHLQRHSPKFPGAGWAKAAGTAVFRPGLWHAQRFVHGAWLTPVWNGFSRAVTLRLLPAFAPKAVPAHTPPRKEWEAARDFLTWVRAQLDAAGRAAQTLLVLGDGAYDTVALWRALPPGVVLLARCAKNRVLRALPSGTDRRRKYGERQPTPQEHLHTRSGWQHGTLLVRGHPRALTYRVNGPCLRERVPDRPLFLLVVKGQTWSKRRKDKPPTRKQRQPAFYLVNAVWRQGRWQLPLPALDLLAWAWQRWELEVAHRELKSGLGLGEKQSWSRCGAEVSVAWTGWVYGLLVLAGYAAWGLNGGPAAPARWWRGAARWSLTTLWRSLRQSFWGAAEFRALWSPTGDDWPATEAWLASQLNAGLAAARI